NSAKLFQIFFSATLPFLSETRNAAVKRTSVFFVVAGAKVNTFPFPPNYFGNFFRNNFPLNL
ncbi:hypothetical protein, partial [Rikenella microfusus]|uniref:hypothetical protein n=1 Tax=Rikenella microfusus TaxID=28139 RepID=UPI003AB30733